MEEDRDIISIKNRRKKSSLSFSGCFYRSRAFGSFDSSSQSPSSWFKSKVAVDSSTEVSSPKIKGRSRLARLRRHSSDFSYDPQSYALNFEEDAADIEEFPMRDFASRLPSSPMRNTQSLNEKLDALDLGRGEKPEAKSEVPTPISLSPEPSSPMEKFLSKSDDKWW